MRRYYSFQGIATNFNMIRTDAEYILAIHDNEMKKNAPDERKLKIKVVNTNNYIIHDYYYNNYLFSIKAKKIHQQRWIISSAKIKIADAIFLCCLNFCQLSLKEISYIYNSINNDYCSTKIFLYMKILYHSLNFKQRQCLQSLNILYLLSSEA